MRSPNWIVAALVPVTFQIATAQSSDQHPSPSPFVVAAATGGVMGFTDGGPSRALLGAYTYAAFPRLLVGAQGGVTPGDGAPDVIYGMATLGYPARAIRQSLIYPFVGFGGGIVDGSLSPRDGGVVVGAGVGADRVVGDGEVGMVIGLRGGYVMRRGDSNERAVYLTLAVGGGGRRREREKTPVIIAAEAPR
jgi:hypothetical protein